MVISLDDHVTSRGQAGTMGNVLYNSTSSYATGLHALFDDRSRSSACRSAADQR